MSTAKRLIFKSINFLNFFGTEEKFKSIKEHFDKIEQQFIAIQSGESGASSGGESADLVGQVVKMFTDEIPVNFLKADGGQYLISEYPELYAKIGTKYGVSPDPNYFFVPNTNGLFLRSVSHDDLNDPDGPRVAGEYQGDAIRNIVGMVGSNQDISPTGVFTRLSGGHKNSGSSSYASRVEFDASRVVPTADENRPKNMTVNYLIRYRNDSSSGGAPSDYTLIQNITYPDRLTCFIMDEKASGDGGTFSAGAWRTRTLNKMTGDPIVTLDDTLNQVTFPPGSYDIEARCPAYDVYRNQARLRNITTDQTAIVGSSCYIVTHANSFSHVVGRIVVPPGENHVFELQHDCDTSQATNGFGVHTNSQDEVNIFSFMKIVKVG